MNFNYSLLTIENINFNSFVRFLMEQFLRINICLILSMNEIHSYSHRSFLYAISLDLIDN